MDFAIVKFLNRLGLGVIDPVTELVSWMPFLVVLWLAVALAFGIWGGEKKKVVPLAMLIAISLHFVLNEWFFKRVMDNVWGFRERPYLAHVQEIVPIGHLYTDTSFPSGHMVSTLAMLTAIVFFARRAWPWAVALALLMAFARMHNGMHHPTDVLAGTFFGAIYGYVGAILSCKLLKYEPKRS